MPRPTEPVAVRHPETEQFIMLDPGVDYPADDILVRTYPGAFEVRTLEVGIVESVSIARPVQKRGRRSNA
jgi:hypothetical protein